MATKKIGFKVNPPKVAKLPGYSKSALKLKAVQSRYQQAKQKAVRASKETKKR